MLKFCKSSYCYDTVMEFNSYPELGNIMLFLVKQILFNSRDTFVSISFMYCALHLQAPESCCRVWPCLFVHLELQCRPGKFGGLKHIYIQYHIFIQYK